MPKWFSYCVIWGHRMTTDKKVACLLELAKDLNCVSQARKLIGYSRQQFYEISCNHQTYATNGWLNRLLGCKGVAIAPSPG